MNTHRLWAPIVILGLIVIGCFCYSYFEKIDRANVDFHHAKLLVEQTHESLISRLKMVETRSKLAATHLMEQQRLHTIDARIRTAERLQAETARKQRLMEDDLKRLARLLTQAVEVARRRLEGTEYMEIELVGGKKLTHARIQKIEDKGVSFTHADGIGTVPYADLPAELVKTLALDGHAVLLKLQAAQKSQDEPSPTDAP